MKKWRGDDCWRLPWVTVLGIRGQALSWGQPSPGWLDKGRLRWREGDPASLNRLGQGGGPGIRHGVLTLPAGQVGEGTRGEEPRVQTRIPYFLWRVVAGLVLVLVLWPPPVPGLELLDAPRLSWPRSRGGRDPTPTAAAE